jgi:hypothetical protein
VIRAGLLALLLTGCGDRATTENEAITAANAYLATMPQMGASHRTVSAIDMGDRWRLSYDMPEGSTGGPLIVVVNKQSGKVVHMETEQ